MPITKAQATRLRAHIERYKNAAIDDSWKGGGHPEDIPEKERELRVSELNLDNLIERLTEHNK